jgi:hypothetical protein
MSRRQFKLARNLSTGEYKWVAEGHGGLKAWVGWFVLAVSTVLFLLVAGYLAYWLLLSRPHFDPASVPDGGEAMRGPAQSVVRLR